ncbi:MAG: hypothetical protein WKH97_04415 [Casimicrobiaceae bacterium]
MAVAIRNLLQRLAVGALLALAVSATPAAGPPAIDASWLVDELLRGGYLVYFRHTTTYREDIEREARNVSSMDELKVARRLALLEAGAPKE